MNYTDRITVVVLYVCIYLSYKLTNQNQEKDPFISVNDIIATVKLN